MKNKYLATILCTSYNHELYIESAIEGFLRQKTNFNYEIIIHDDASIDNTQNIIRKYENIENITLIFQEENQFSKGVKIYDDILIPRAKGKYIAICEGDDFWINSNKLQMQVDYMEGHSDCTFCFTNAKIMDVNTNKEKIFLPYDKFSEPFFYDENYIYDVGKLSLLGFIPTASFLFRKENFYKMPKSYYEDYPAEDRKWELFFSALGYAYYINEITCVYRKNVPNSLMSTWKKYEPLQKVENSEGYLKLHDNINSFTLNKFRKDIEKSNYLIIRSIIFESENFKILKNKRYEMVFNRLPFLDKIRFLIKAILPTRLNYLLSQSVKKGKIRNEKK